VQRLCSLGRTTIRYFPLFTLVDPQQNSTVSTKTVSASLFLALQQSPEARHELSTGAKGPLFRQDPRSALQREQLASTSHQLAKAQRGLEASRVSSTKHCMLHRVSRQFALVSQQRPLVRWLSRLWSKKPRAWASRRRAPSQNSVWLAATLQGPLVHALGEGPCMYFGDLQETHKRVQSTSIQW
jgi:hypothetical protein